MEQASIRYYHVAGPDYRDGDDLLCWDELDAMGQAPSWKWDGEPELDTDVVCLFETIEEAREFQAEFQPAGRILAVDLPEDYEAWGIMMTRVSEGYPAVFCRIPAEFVSPL